MKGHRLLLRWIGLSFAVIIAMAVMIRLGFWQLDRLEQRRSFNARVRANQAAPALDLNANPLPENPVEFEYRSVVVEGTYLTDEEVLLRNQAQDGQVGVHILAALQIGGSDQAVVVDRGWVPLTDANPERISKYAQVGVVKIKGVLRLTQKGLKAANKDTPGGRLTAINAVDIPRLAAQSSLPLIPMFIQEAPGDQAGSLPIRSLPDLDLSEGPHASYALQWFTFAGLLAIGYPYYAYKHLRRPVDGGHKAISGPSKPEHGQHSIRMKD